MVSEYSIYRHPEGEAAPEPVPTHSAGTQLREGAKPSQAPIPPHLSAEAGSSRDLPAGPGRSVHTSCQPPHWLTVLSPVLSQGSTGTGQCWAPPGPALHRVTPLRPFCPLPRSLVPKAAAAMEGSGQAHLVRLESRSPRLHWGAGGWLGTGGVAGHREGSSRACQPGSSTEQRKQRGCPVGCSKGGTQDSAPDPPSLPANYKAELHPCKRAFAHPKPMTTVRSPLPHKTGEWLREKRGLPGSCLLPSLAGLPGGAGGQGLQGLGRWAPQGPGGHMPRAVRAPSQLRLPALGPCRGQVGPRGRRGSGQREIRQQSGARLWFQMPPLLLEQQWCRRGRGGGWGWRGEGWGVAAGSVSLVGTTSH